MASAQHKLTSYQRAWKLQDTVKLMSINVSKAYRKTHKGNGLIPREIKKWMKVDIYLLEYEMPVIKYCPKNADTSSTVTVQLSDIIKVEHIYKFSKPNVLAIDFPLCSLLLSFKSKEMMEKWMSELLCLTDIYTLLLYDSSNVTIKLGFYQLRFMLDRVTVYNAITKKAMWKWNISHIRGYTKTKSGIKIEVGEGSPVNGYFNFTGKQLEPFCKQLQKFSHKIAQKKLKRGQTFPVCRQPAQSVENLLMPSRIGHSMPRCSNVYVTTAPSNIYPSVSVPMNLNKSHLHNHQYYQKSTRQLYSMSSTSSSNSLQASCSDIASFASVSSFEAPSISLIRSTSLDTFKDNDQTKQQKKSLRKCTSLNLSSSEEDDDKYVLPSVLPLNAECRTLKTSCSSDYLTILPNKIYEELRDPDGHYERVRFEPQYSSIK